MLVALTILDYQIYPWVFRSFSFEQKNEIRRRERRKGIFSRKEGNRKKF
jgi:hypothetical protein